MSGPRTWSVLVLGLLFGCHSDLPEVHWEGEHILFAADHPEQVCGGTLEYLDRRTGQMLERLGAEPDKITYYFLDDVSEYCVSGPLSYGCAEPGVVYSETVPHLHEIVHARSGDNMFRVLEEGLAHYLGDPYPVLSKLSTRDRLAELLGSGDKPTTLGDYARAGHFVEGGFALLRRCGSCAENGVMGFPAAGPYFIPKQDLPAGRYLVRLYLPVEAGAARVGLRIDD